MKNLFTYYIFRKIMVIVMISLISLQVSAQKDACIADFTFTVNSERPSLIDFTDASTGDITFWKWNFNDNPNGGSFSYGQNPVHAFPKNGDYQVSLTIGNDSCSDQITKTIQIDVPLSIDFTFQLDSSNITPNTFVFQSQIDGFYDNLFWNFDNQIISNRVDTTHSYPLQDHEYQVGLTAEYIFNDTSIMRKVLYKGLTTSEYFDMGGQVFFGDSLLNNPYSTGDSAVAYLYRDDNNAMVAIDTNYFSALGYYWFSQKLKAHYIVKTALLANSVHFNNFAPTYVGNTTQWDEAEIINLAQDKFREDVNLVEKTNIQAGTKSIEGSVLDILDINNNKDQAVVYLFDMDEKLIDYKYADNKGRYSFENIYQGHYMLSADITGIPVRPQLIYINDKFNDEYKTAIIENSIELFPNPANNYSILSFNNDSDSKEIKAQIISANGSILKELQLTADNGNNFFSISLSEFNKGLLLIRILDNDSQTVLRLLHY